MGVFATAVMFGAISGVIGPLPTTMSKCIDLSDELNLNINEEITDHNSNLYKSVLQSIDDIHKYIPEASINDLRPGVLLWKCVNSDQRPSIDSRYPKDTVHFMDPTL